MTIAAANITWLKDSGLSQTVSDIDGTTTVLRGYYVNSMAHYCDPLDKDFQAEVEKAIAAGVTVEPVQSLTELKAVKKGEVEAERDQRIAAGFAFTFSDGTTGTVQIRHERDMNNLQTIATTGSALLAAGDTTTTQPFRDAENVTHHLPPQEAVDLGVAAAQRGGAIYAASWDHKASVDALTTKADVEAYDLSAGWPA